MAQQEGGSGRDATSPPRPPRLPVVLVTLAFALISLLLGVRTGYRTMDVDEVVFRSTLQQMHSGRGYYPAMRTALAQKEGAPPSQIRSVRPPTMFLLLAYLPEGAWRWASALPIFATIIFSVALARRFDHRAAVPAAVLSGLWMIGASPLLFLHPELWGLPFLLSGLWCLFSGRRDTAAWLLLGASVIRELYLLWFAIGLFLCRRRRAWWAATVPLVTAGAIHAYLASRILVREGREPALNGTWHRLSSFLGGFSPSGSLIGGAVGIAAGILGLIALARLARRGPDPAVALAVLAAATTMLFLTTIAGRQYWGLTFGPVLAIFAPLAPLRRIATAP